MKERMMKMRRRTAMKKKENKYDDAKMDDNEKRWRVG